MNRLQQHLTIQQISRKLNIPKSTLRFWEKELDGIVVPIRTLGKQRRYTFEHLSILKEIKHLRGSGTSLAEIKRKLGNSHYRNNSNPDGINLLAERVAAVVKAEISSFFQAKQLKTKTMKVDEP